MPNKQGRMLLAIIAFVAFAIYAMVSAQGPCKRTETREVEMTHNGKFGGGLRKHQYQVCVER